VSDSICEIPLYGKGGVVGHTRVDEDDWFRFARYRWHKNAAGYVVGRMTSRCGPRATTHAKQVYLHRLIAGVEAGEYVDHASKDRLDNRRANLRIVTNAQNAQNQGAKGGTSRYRGVTWDKRRRHWRAKAKLDGRTFNLGSFLDEAEAGAAAAAWRAQHMPYSEEAAV
jgi:hypothetical protein